LKQGRRKVIVMDELKTVSDKLVEDKYVVDYPIDE
jgi:hypothetical protein